MKLSRIAVIAVVGIMVAGGMVEGAVTNVNIFDFGYSPPSVTISAGDTVNWINNGTFTHTTTSGTSPTPDGLWDSGFMNSGGNFARQFPAAGSFSYFCTLHAFMTGSVTVLAANTPPSVALISPTNGASFTEPATLILAATAADADGSITNVLFLDNSTPLGRATNNPFSLIASLATGTHALAAVASDNLGATATSAVVVMVLASNLPPAQPAFIEISLSNKFPSPPLTTTTVPVITNGLVTLRWTGDARGRFDLFHGPSPGGAFSLAQPNITGTLSGTNVLRDPPYLAGPAYPANTKVFYRLTALPPQAPGLPIALAVVASNLVSPTVLTHAGDGSGRLFIADQVGFVRVVDGSGALLPAPFLNITNRLITLNAGYDERGLLGLAFHPGYATNGQFYVYYSAPPSGPGFNNRTVLAEFLVSSTNANVADPSSERVLLTIDQPESNHEGAAIVFGPDGYLYLGPGDGGGGGDQHGVYGNGQVLTNLLGKILRIDPDGSNSVNGQYGIPADNPFVGVAGALPEIYAYGFRNPWRFSFDRGGTHAGFVADVGQNFWEEINLLRKGGNYGWRIMEGQHIFDPTVAAALAVSIPALDMPIHEYDHASVGIAIIGGFVYRGSAYPELAGKYVFGDFSTGFGSPDGQLLYLDETRPGIWERFAFQLWPGGVRLGRFVKGFGEDQAGELYVLSTTALGPSGTTGDVRRLIRP